MIKKYEGFLDFFRKKKPQPSKVSINYNEVIQLTKDSFAELVDNGWTVNNKYMEFPYVQITKDKLIRRKVLQEVPYKFIDVKDDVLSFCDRVMELGVEIEIAYVYENDKGGYSKDEPTYEDFESGKYDNREVSILTIDLFDCLDK